jgi:polyisoprenoid-binding protein YceI
MKTITIACIMGIFSLTAFSQSLFMTRSGQVSFFSKTPMENIEAVNNEVTSMLNTSTGEIVFAILIKSFRFEKALMEEHFNENYMDSDKLPKSTFQGKITNLASIDFAKDGTYPVTVEGDITIHGVKQHVSTNGTAIVGNGKVVMTCLFTVKPSDYKIEIPALVEDKIAKTLDIKVNCQYEPKS